VPMQERLPVAKGVLCAHGRLIPCWESVTGQRSNQLNYVPTVAEMLLEVADFDATSAFQMSTKQQQHTMKKPDDTDYDFQSKADTVIKVKQSFSTLRKAIFPTGKTLGAWRCG
jgi:hypothetical protein